MCRFGPYNMNIIALRNYKCSLREHENDKIKYSYKNSNRCYIFVRR